jgi:tripartite-type tricarboxylate transporter receptor subunit TctC
VKRIIFCVSFLVPLLGGIFNAGSQEYFKGKSIRLLIGTSTGGAMDDWGRFLAPHLSKNIPGSPDIVVQNMAGAGTIIAANYVYGVAKPDGLTLGLVNPAIYIDQLLGAKEVKFDWPNSPGSAPRKKSIRCCLPVRTLPTRPWKICARQRSRRGVRLWRVPA